MKRIKMKTGLLLLFLLSFLICMPVSAANLSNKSISLQVGQTQTLKLSGVKSKSKIKWKSSNKKIAEVSSKGKVTAISKGRCTITATYKNKKYKCTVQVSGIDLCQTSASKILTYIKNYGLKVQDKKVYNKETDPNEKIGTPDGYHSKCDFYNWTYCEDEYDYCTIEVFSNSYLAEQRQNYIESCYKLYPFLREQMYRVEGVVIRFPRYFPKNQAKKYIDALNKIKQ